MVPISAIQRFLQRLSVAPRFGKRALTPSRDPLEEPLATGLVLGEIKLPDLAQPLATP